MKIILANVIPYRQAANGDLYVYKEDIEKMPSVKITTCKDCRHYIGYQKKHCLIHNWQSSASDYCSAAELKNGESV